jgi:hypothetical protein
MRGALAVLAFCGCAGSVSVERPAGQLRPKSVALIDFVSTPNVARRADVEISIWAGCIAAAVELDIRPVDYSYVGRTLGHRADTLVRGRLEMQPGRRGSATGIMTLELISTREEVTLAKAVMKLDAGDPDLAGRLACRALLDPGAK